jgi:hypothetical protein
MNQKLHILNIQYWGGIGDMIKYMMYFIEKFDKLCQTSEDKFCINIEHPIKNYLIFKNDNINYSKYNRKEYDQILYTTTNFFNEYNDLDIETINFYKYFNFTDEIYKKYNEIKPNNNYETIHIRLGDKYLENTNRIGPLCNDDDRIKNKDENYYFDIIGKIISESKNDVILLSDNKNFKNNCKNKFNQLIINDINIIHTGNRYEDGTDYNKELIMTLSEFLLISNSSKVHALTYSGFSIIAHKILSISQFIKYY